MDEARGWTVESLAVDNYEGYRGGRPVDENRRSTEAGTLESKDGGAGPRFRMIEGSRNNEIEIEHPTLSEVIDAVKSLNGRSKSSMCIIGGDDSIFCVGGGPGEYHVQVTLADNRVFILNDPRKPADQVTVIIGAVETPLPANLIVDADMALMAVEEYFSFGVLALSLKWVEG